MAKYKNREVTLIRELYDLKGNLAEIEHREPGMLNAREIVPLHAVTLSKDEMKVVEKARENRDDESRDFQVEGETNYPVPAPMIKEVAVQKLAEQKAKEAKQEEKKTEKK